MKHLTFIFPFVAWIVSGILTVLDWIAVRDLIIDLAIRATEIVPFEEQVLSGYLHRWVIPALDGFGVLLCGLVAFGLVLAFEPIYRKAQEEGVLRRRFARITATQVVFFLVCRLLYVVLGLL